MNKTTIFGLLCLTSASLFARPDVQFSGPVGFEVRQFTNDGETQASVYTTPKWQWRAGDSAFSVELFGRYDDLDDERTHGDIREATWLYLMDNWEIKAGVGKIFWGVTETQHLVDIINQTDAVEAIDGEEKLGQPMIQITFVRDWGTLDAFILPYFRERTFAGEEGRFLAPLPIDTDNARYESSEEEKHVDFAARYSNYVGDWDFGVSYFQGTNRDPKFETVLDLQQGLILVPFYDQIKQLGLDVQATKGAWLWKLEVIGREDSVKDYAAAVGGFEYTLFGVAESNLDWGILLELSRDSRGEEAPVPAQKDLSLANRVTFNDVDGSEILFGVNIDLDDKERYSAFLETSRRFGNRIRVSFEGWLFASGDPQDPVWQIRDEDYVQANLEYFF